MRRARRSRRSARPAALTDWNRHISCDSRTERIKRRRAQQMTSSSWSIYRERRGGGLNAADLSKHAVSKLAVPRLARLEDSTPCCAMRDQSPKIHLAFLASIHHVFLPAPRSFYPPIESSTHNCRDPYNQYSSTTVVHFTLLDNSSTYI